MAKNLIDIWFYVNPESQATEKIVAFWPLGMMIRESGNWQVTDRENSGIDEISDYQIYVYNWESDSTTLAEEFSDEDLTPATVVAFDNGTLEIDAVKASSNLIYDGAEEA
jgi:hypothetical protein